MSGKKRVKPSDRKKIRGWVNKWRPKLFLGEWFIDLDFTDEEASCSAEASVNPRYMKATIIIHNNFFKYPAKQQEHVLVHELCHLLTDEAYQLHIDSLNFKVVTQDHIEKLREQLTQRIANIAFQEEWP